MENSALHAVNNPDKLFGRRTLISKVFARIGAVRPQSVSLVGDAKMGKTSVLACLVAPPMREAMLSRPEDYVIASLSISALHIENVEGFIKHLQQQLQPYLEEKKPPGENANRYDWLKKLAEDFTRQNKKLIMLFDDFNLITQNQDFPLEFFSFLRSLANNHNVAYVTTSYLDLQKLCISKDVEESPFFNIFTNMMLKGLEKNDAQLLMQHIFLKIKETQQQRLWELCGGFPYLIKLAAESCRAQDITPESGAFEEVFYQRAKPYFQLLWQRYENEHRHILEKVARRKKIHPTQRYLLNDLERKGYVLEEHKVELFSPLFRRFIAETNNFSYNTDNPFSAAWQSFVNLFRTSHEAGG